MTNLIPEGCRFHGPAPYSDDARRMAAEITIHILSGLHGHWAAIRLIDGGSDHEAYPTRKDAIRHQLDESLCCYIKIPRDQMQAHEAEHLLNFYRHCRDNGIPIADPEREVIPASWLN